MPVGRSALSSTPPPPENNRVLDPEGSPQHRSSDPDPAVREREKREHARAMDVDVEKVIVELTTQESVHRAALAVGARIIQPTLVDFLN